MLIIVTHNMVITHIIHWKKIKKLFGNVFRNKFYGTRFFKKSSSFVSKPIMFLNICFLRRNYAIHTMNTKKLE